MPIRQYLNGHTLDDETVRLLGLAFETTHAAFKIEDSNEPAKQLMADKLIELADLGERDPSRLAERALAWLREATPF